MDLAALGVQVASEALAERLDGERVATDDEAFELVDGCLDRPAEPVQRALTEAVDAFVGVDADEQPVLPPVADQVGRDAGDLHNATWRDSSNDWMQAWASWRARRPARAWIGGSSARRNAVTMSSRCSSNMWSKSRSRSLK